MTKKKIGTELSPAVIEEERNHLISTTVQGTYRLRLSEKFKAWATLFMDQSNPKYWGNATRCALEVYNTTNYASASQIGYENLRKLEKVACFVLDNQNMGFGELMKIGLSKMLQGSYSDWEAFMERLGYFEPRSKTKTRKKESFNFKNLNVAIMRDRKARGLDY